MPWLLAKQSRSMRLHTIIIIFFLVEGENESGLRVSRGTLTGRQSISSTQTCRNSLDFRSKTFAILFRVLESLEQDVIEKYDYHGNKVNNKLRIDQPVQSVYDRTPFTHRLERRKENPNDRDARFW